MDMIADAKFWHDGKQLFTGNEFTTTDGNAADLIALHWAHPDPNKKKKEEEKVVAKVEVAETQHSGSRRHSNNYRRRDLTAEPNSGQPPDDLVQDSTAGEPQQ